MITKNIQSFSFKSISKMFVFMVVNYFILKFKGKRKGNLKLKYKCFFFNQLCTPQSCAINPNIDHENKANVNT